MRTRIGQLLQCWCALALCWSLVAGVIVLVQHQVLRQQADEPQVQLAEDAARQLDDSGAKWMPPAAPEVAIERSLAPWLLVYDLAGLARGGNGRLHGAPPKLPGGVLEFARAHGGHRLSWQPEPGVRQALVVVPAKSGFAVAGRSLRETEARKRQVLHLVLMAWGAGLLGLFVPAGLLASRNGG